MEKLVIDCSGGARKAQLVNMLVELLDEEQRAAFAREFGALGVPGLAGEFDGEGRFVVLSDGLTEAEARHEHKHEHRSLEDVRVIVASSGAPPSVAADAMGVYGVLAEAEAKAHGADVAHVHFHEVGNDYFIIYQTGRQRYILCDIYALKYMEFYDTKQRELCEHLLQENGSQGFC